MTVTVTNTGNSGIRKGDFDDEAPFGLTFLGAEIVDAPAVHASNEYLERSVKLSIQRDRIIFSPSIIEAQDSVQISVLLLGPQDTTPVIQANGKISGISKFVVTTDGISGNKSTWEKVVGADNYLIQLYRVAVYPVFGALGLLISILVLVSPFMLINEQRARKGKSERKKKISEVMVSIKGQDLRKELQQEYEALSNLYIEEGEHTLAMLKGAVADEKKRRAIYEKCVNDIELPTLDNFIVSPDSLHRWLKFDDFEKAGLISYKAQDGNMIPVYSPTLESSIDELTKRLGIDLDVTLREQRLFEGRNRV